MKTTFYTVEVCGPRMPIPTGTDSAAWKLYERSSTFRCAHLSGAWKPESLQRMAARRGVKLLSAYWMHYSTRHGYSGATKHEIEVAACIEVQ